MNKALITLSALTTLAGVASAADTASVEAYETGTIQPGGPRQGANGSNFFNVEGVDNATFASYGTCRWDLAAAKAQFDTAFGAGNWSITAVSLKMTQSNAGFTKDGAVDLYISSDDSTDCKTLSSPLTYPFFDGTTPDLALLNAGAAICKYSFVAIGTGQVDEYTQASGPGGPSEALALAPDLIADCQAGGVLTLVFVDAASNVAATYRGQNPNGDIKPPTLVITADGKSGECYPDCDADTALTIDDFICFQTFFALGDPYADCDADTSLTIDDFICFQTFFAIGC